MWLKILFLGKGGKQVSEKKSGVWADTNFSIKVLKSETRFKDDRWKREEEMPPQPRPPTLAHILTAKR